VNVAQDLQRPDLMVAVIGAGTMGRGIAQVCAQAGMTALLFDAREGAAREAVAAIDKALDAQVAKGRLTADVKLGVIGRLRAIGSLDEVAPAGIVIEAIVEDLAAKRELLRELEQRIAPDAVIATNTSSLSVTEIAAGCGNPGRVAGLHFFNPPPLMRLARWWRPTRPASWSITPAAPMGRRRCASSRKASRARARSIP